MAWHLLNFFAPALGVAVLSSTTAKVLWRSELKGVAWGRLCLWNCAVGGAVLILGLVILGHDGKMATYLLLVVTTALLLWWIGFRPFRR
ncbi:MAG: hypothetical protein ABIV63_01665 [Caldimonas sp.]